MRDWKISGIERVKVLRKYLVTADVVKSVRAVYPEMDPDKQVRVARSVRQFIHKMGLDKIRPLRTYLEGFKSRGV